MKISSGCTQCESLKIIFEYRQVWFPTNQESSEQGWKFRNCVVCYPCIVLVLLSLNKNVDRLEQTSLQTIQWQYLEWELVIVVESWSSVDNETLENKRYSFSHNTCLPYQRGFAGTVIYGVHRIISCIWVIPLIKQPCFYLGLYTLKVFLTFFD